MNPGRPESRCFPLASALLCLIDGATASFLGLIDIFDGGVNLFTCLRLREEGGEGGGGGEGE